MLKKLIKYRGLILQVVYLTCKYQLIVYTYSSEKLIQSIYCKNVYLNNTASLNPSLQLKNRLLRLTDIIINYISLNTTCLVRSLVKRDLLMKFDFKEPISLGLSVETEQLKAHAWIGETQNNKFRKVL